MSEIVILLEEESAKYLGNQIKTCRVETFASEFADMGKPQGRSHLLFGHSGSTFNVFTEVPILSMEEVATYEARLEVVDLKNHRAALQLIALVVQTLSGYAPYTNVRPLIPVGYGTPTFNRASGIWTYNATFRTSFVPTNEFLLKEIQPEESFVGIGLYNSWTLTAEDASLVTRIPQEDS